jgi:polygalacturonase
MATRQTSPRATVRITDVGGVGDGLYDNTDAFRRGVAAVHAAGGGRLVVPRGVFWTGPIRLLSGVHLELENGAVVRFSDRLDDYPLGETVYEGFRQWRAVSPIHADDAEDIGVVGTGVVDGSGQAWRPVKRGKVTAAEWRNLVELGGVVDRDGGTWWPSSAAEAGSRAVPALWAARVESPEAYRPYRDFLRPALLAFRGCRRVHFSGVVFQNSPAWALHLFDCEDVTVEGVTVLNPWNAQNGDGIDIESCRRVVVRRSRFDVGDDAICLKSGRDAAGRAAARPTEDVVVEDCVVWRGHGGLTIGSEMSGGVRRVEARRLTCIGTDVGLRFKTVRGRGGTVEDVDIADVALLRIPGPAILFDMHYAEEHPDYHEARPVTEETPCFRDIRVRDVTIDGATAVLVVDGLPEMPVERLHLARIRARAERGLLVRYARNMAMSDAVLAVKPGTEAMIEPGATVAFDRVFRLGPDGLTAVPAPVADD